MFNHNCEPLFKVLLHPNSASFEQILDPLNFCFQIFQLIVFLLVVMFVLIDLSLKRFFLFSPNNFSIFINHASKCILFTNLFDLVSKIFDLSPCCIDALTKLLASTVLFLEQSSIFLHGLILAIAFPEHFKGLCSICQVFKTALDGLVYKSLCFLEFSIEAC